MKENRSFSGISSFALHLIAMALMLCDHLWATALSQYGWLSWLGRVAFPIFAFLIVEGYFHTRSLKKYLFRMLVFALVSELPFNLMYSGGWRYPYHQNVIWTFLIALCCLWAIDTVRKKGKWWLTVLVGVMVTTAGFVLGTLLMVDYFGFGVLTVIVFYLFRGHKWWQLAGQAAGLYWINGVLLAGLVVPVTLFGFELEIAKQSMAMAALIPIWLYRGRQGVHNKLTQYAFYAFYPVHILLLSLFVLR